MTAEVKTEKLIKDFKTLARDAEDLLKSAASDLNESARERLHTAMESARGTFEELQEKAADSAKKADKTIRSHPYESIGVAFGVGLLLGLFISRK